MANILMVYGTTDGYTHKIVDYLAELVRSEGHSVQETAVELVHTGYELDGFDGILLAASVHVGRHRAAVRKFVEMNRGRLSDVPSAFLSVSMSARDDAHRAAAERYVESFLTKTGWKPTVKGVAGGALRYTRYGAVKRTIVKRIARSDGMPIDTSRDFEFTDWERVRQFGLEFLRSVQPHALDAMVGTA